MTEDDATDQLQRLIEPECLDDPTWLQELTEFDEPPLFLRFATVQFLGELSEPERMRVLLHVAVNWLDRVATTISSFRDADRFFLTLSFVGWDYFDSREQTVPTPALFVSPNWNVELASLTVRRPQTERGLRLQGWFEDLNRSDLCVAESVRNPDPPPRVFLGYRSASKFRSIGSFMSPAELT